MASGIEVVAVPVEAILEWRERYRREMSCQIVHDSYHARGFTDSYRFTREGRMVGYGSVAGDPHPPREIVKEFYLEPEERETAVPFLRRLVQASGARRIEAQSNDPLLAPLLRDCAEEVEEDRILFADACVTRLETPRGARFRAVTDADRGDLFEHTREPVGEWGVELDSVIVGTGGLGLHYNPPYADLFMEVAPAHRRRGIGSYLIQELKRVAYESGRRPAARCAPDNPASRRTLERAGLMPCGRLLRGRLAL